MNDRTMERTPFGFFIKILLYNSHIAFLPLIRVNKYGILHTVFYMLLHADTPRTEIWPHN